MLSPSSPSPSTDRRIIIVSNRLPVTARVDDGHVRLRRASGGLATGLRTWYTKRNGLWIGWPGDVSRFSADERQLLEHHLRTRHVAPVYLDASEVEQYYEGFANRVLWPLFHYLIDRVPVDASGWEAYRRANEKFADVVVQHYEPGDLIWVHDYQLMLLPALLRQRLPGARIGFFLHIPFPSSEVFRILPWRREILHGLLGADHIGFHTFSYLRHFLMSLVHVDGLEAEVDSVQVGDRRVRLGVHPMGIDATRFEALARDPRVVAEADAIRSGAGGRRIVLGIDRLDYTKGIPRRLSAIERLLERDPSLRDRLRYIQVAVPSRGMVDSYQTFKRQVEEMVGRINGTCGTLRSTPIHYMHGSVSPHQLAALYRAADVMLVTPLRDGMNLVAKEFVASRVDGDGVLILSEFAGSAAELGEAIVVNPYDLDAVGDAIQLALTLNKDQRRTRMACLRTRVKEHDVHRWASEYLSALGTENAPPALPVSAMSELPDLVDRLAPASPLSVLLDYDGTLVPLAPLPRMAAPDPALVDLLRELAHVPGIDVHIVSGRPRESLETWFGDLPVWLWAEHAFWHRPRGAEQWDPAASLPTDWMKKVAPILEQFTIITPGSFVETKSVSLAWHYRMADPAFGARQAHELRLLLGDTLSNQPLEVLEGHKVIEVRYRGMNKAAVARHIDVPTGGAVLAIGDDRTDDDLFGALPPEAITISVGARPSVARHRLPDHAAVRMLLRQIIEARGRVEGQQIPVPAVP